LKGTTLPFSPGVEAQYAARPSISLRRFGNLAREFRMIARPCANDGSRLCADPAEVRFTPI
jgi:hypothetical protein